jgi:hypothetical protein
MAVFKELWTDIIREEFFPDSSFLNEPISMDAFVENNKLHMTLAGAKPNVLVNNTSWPIGSATRTDVDKERSLNTFDSENTIIRSIDELETNYAKRESVLRQHRNVLFERAAIDASFNFLPASTAALTPVIETTGTLVSGFRQTKRADIIELARRLDLQNIPREGRVIVMHPDALAEIMVEDITLFNQITAATNGQSLATVYGFKVYIYTIPHLYVAANTKKALGSTYAATDKYVRALVFHNQEVFRAMGTIDMFETIKDPGQRGDILGFQMRFLAATVADRAIGALITATS